MRYGVLFLLIGAALTAFAVQTQGWRLLLCWPALSFVMVGTAYLGLGPRVFGKTPQGRLAWPHTILLLPFLLCLRVLWSSLRLVSREPPFHQVTETLTIGRRLLAREVPANLDHIVDLTSEWSVVRYPSHMDYLSFPILDNSVPPVSALQNWVNQVAGLSGRVYVHCAEGHGRTGLFAAALLLATGQASSPDAAVHLLRAQRPGVRLNRPQRRLLQEYYTTCVVSDSPSRP